MKDFMRILIGIVIGVVCMGFYMQNDPIISKQAEKILGKTDTVAECDKIKVHKQKKKKRKELGLDKEIIENKTIHIADAIRIEPDNHSHIITALYYSDENKIDLLDTQQPLPWLRFTNKTFIGYHYGIKDERTVSRLTLGMNLINIKAIKFDVKIDVDSDNKYFIAAGGRLHF